MALHISPFLPSKKKISAFRVEKQQFAFVLLRGGKYLEACLYKYLQFSWCNKFFGINCVLQIIA